jgi:hypothetical protein
MYNLFISKSPVIIFCGGTVASLFRDVINNESDLLVDDDKDQTLWTEVIVQKNVGIVMMMNKRTHIMLVVEM